MKRVSSQSLGYTIIEVLIVMAVTGTLIVSVMRVFSGQQGKTEFNQAVQEFDSQLQDIINDVSTGYYNNPGIFNCDAPAAGSPSITSTDTNGNGVHDATEPSTTGQGSNQNCIFVGKVIQLGVGSGSDSNNKIGIYTVVGRRLKNSSTDTVTTLDEAKPASHNVLYKSHTFDNGVEVEPSRTPTRVFGIYSTFGAAYTVGGGASNSGKTNTRIKPIADHTPNPVAGGSWIPANVIDDISFDTDESNANPASGIVLCLKSAKTKQFAKIKVGGDKRSSGTIVTIGNDINVC